MFLLTVSPQAKASYLALAYIGRRAISISTPKHDSSQYFPSDFKNQGFTGLYEPGEPTVGPLAGASIVGTPRHTPKALKEHLDQFVVGQDRAKKVLSVAVFNHYQRIQELQRQEEKKAELEAQAMRREMGHRHPIEDEYPGQQPTVTIKPPVLPSTSSSTPDHVPPSSGAPLIVDDTPLQIEKSNVLLLGPSGVGKTLIAKTLARVIDVPFSISDCTPLTSAGYVGEDVESCVRRLLIAADYDVTAAERGIIVLDEIDKIACRQGGNIKDIGGEGVQQALLKIIEGTTVTFQDKAPPGGAQSAHRTGNGNPLGGSKEGHGHSKDHPVRSPMNVNSMHGHIYTIRTDNILFICAGAFTGLHKLIMDRLSKGSIGFGAPVRSSDPGAGVHETMFKGDLEVFKKNLPFYVAPQPESQNPFKFHKAKPAEQTYNSLDLVESSDLQKFGMIPELIGRVPMSCALSALDEEALVRVLTEPRHSLLKQYEKLFQLSGIELRFTSAALREVAKAASIMKTGARGLRTVMERLLGDCMFETPGSLVKHVLITQSVAKLECAPLCFQRGQSHSFQSAIAEEEEKWEEELNRRENQANMSTFEEYRSKGLAAGGFM